MKEIQFTPVNEALPERQAFVYIKRNDGTVTKGMFYMNGRKPTFAAYGSEVVGVLAWAYRK